ncbi:hypothetical protein DRO59_02245 [Candidatus Bathyarchaeota archaeon]|nr:MAG: hypothetical protein DRO59_02245 [Candidatus Bathyarchaeota archaeon]
MKFSVVAKYCGDAVSFEIDASNVKEAYKLAKKEAVEIFDYKPSLGEAPQVIVKQLEDLRELKR